LTRRRAPILTAFMTSALVALALMPGAVSASGDATVAITNVVNQGGLYTSTNPAAGFFNVTATNTGGSHLTHEDLRVYVPLSFTPLAAFTMVGGVQTLEPGCSIPSRGSDATIPAFLCSWDENWDLGDGKGPITFAVGGSTPGTFDISATLSPAAQPPIGSDIDTITVTTVGGGDRATYYTGPTSSLTAQTSGVGNQSTKAELLTTNNGYVVDLAETSDTFTCGSTTPTGQIGQLITSHINQGASVSPFIKWTVVIVVPGTPPYDTSNLAIYHCSDTGVLDTITQTEVCGVPTATAGCMISVSSKFLVTRGVATTTVTVVFETLTNGFIKGGAG
jgi:hypothetical protein